MVRIVPQREHQDIVPFQYAGRNYGISSPLFESVKQLVTLDGARLRFALDAKEPSIVITAAAEYFEALARLFNNPQDSVRQQSVQEKYQVLLDVLEREEQHPNEPDRRRILWDLLQNSGMNDAQYSNVVTMNFETIKGNRRVAGTLKLLAQCMKSHLPSDVAKQYEATRDQLRRLGIVS